MRVIYNIILLSIVLLNAKEYKAIVKPYDSWDISAQKSGVVVKLNKSKELKYNSGIILEIDHKLEDIQLKNYRAKLKVLRKQLQINKRNYLAIKQIRGKSQYEKSAKELTYLSSKSTVYDMINTIEQLKDTIAKKIIKLDSVYIKKHYVSIGEYVNIGTKLLSVEEHKAVRIVIYVTLKDIKNIKKKTILINGKQKSGYRIEKVSTTPDETYISSYRVELVKIGGKKDLGKIVSIDIKDYHEQ